MSLPQSINAQPLPIINSSHFSMGYDFDGFARSVQDFKQIAALDRQPLTPIK